MSASARDVILPHFPDLSGRQIDQLDTVSRVVGEWNDRINVVSRKDPQIMEHHVLHSLGIALVQRFQAGSRVLDVGTGGGFPGLPLAILHPESEFILCDSIGKKIKVVEAAASAAGLSNVHAIHARAENIEGTFDFVVSRAVTRMSGFLKWVENKIRPENLHAMANGVLYLKGGDLREELSEVSYPTSTFALSQWMGAPFFDTKMVVHVDMSLRA